MPACTSFRSSSRRSRHGDVSLYHGGRILALSRVQILESIYTDLRANATLPLLLGPVSPTNPRILRSYAELQSILSTPPGYDPSGGEGWLVFQEAESKMAAYSRQEETIYELCDFDFIVYATRYSIADDVTDVLDGLYHWSVQQQREITFGERILLMSRRLNTFEKYAQEIKLVQKTSFYRMGFVLETQIA